MAQRLMCEKWLLIALKLALVLLKERSVRLGHVLNESGQELYTGRTNNHTDEGWGLGWSVCVDI